MIHLTLKPLLGPIRAVFQHFLDDMKRRRLFTKQETIDILKACSEFGYVEVDLKAGIYKKGVPYDLQSLPIQDSSSSHNSN